MSFWLTKSTVQFKSMWVTLASSTKQKPSIVKQKNLSTQSRKRPLELCTVLAWPCKGVGVRRTEPLSVFLCHLATASTLNLTVTVCNVRMKLLRGRAAGKERLEGVGTTSGESGIGGGRNNEPVGPQWLSCQKHSTVSLNRVLCYCYDVALCKDLF